MPISFSSCFSTLMAARSPPIHRVPAVEAPDPPWLLIALFVLDIGHIFTAAFRAGPQPEMAVRLRYDDPDHIVMYIHGGHSNSTGRITALYLTTV